MKGLECERNAIRRAAFVQRACEKLPNLSGLIDVKATELFGDVGGQAFSRLNERLARRRKAWEAFARGKPFEVDVSGEIDADGALDPRFAECVRAARDVAPAVGNRFQLDGEHVVIAWASGGYRIQRTVCISSALDDGRPGVLSVAEDLLRRGGLCRVLETSDGFAVLGVAPLPTWRLLLRVIRELGPRGRTEALRRARSGIPFEYLGTSRNNVKAILRAGRMPADVKDEFASMAESYARRIQRLERKVADLEAEGRSEADRFTANPQLQGAQFDAAKRDLHEQFKSSQARLMEVMALVCYKRDIPDVPPNSVPGFWPRCRPGLSHRLHGRWEAARRYFEEAVTALTAAGEAPEGMRVDRAGQGVLLTLE